MPSVSVDNVGGVGLVKDVPPHRLPKEAWTDGRNVRFGPGGAQQVQNERPVLGAPSASDIYWLQQFPTEGAPLWLYSDIESGGGGNAGVYVVDSSEVHSDVSKGGAGGVYSTVATERPNAGTFQGSAFWNNTLDVPQWWSPMAVGTNLIDMPNWSTHDEGSGVRCKWMRPYKNFLVMGYVSSGASEWPYEIRWSNPAQPGAAPTSWAVSSAANLAGKRDLAETPDYLVDALLLGEILVIYKQRSTWGMQLIQSNEVFRTWQILPSSGLLWRDCVSAFPGGHFVATQDDLIIHQGARGSEQSILQDRMRSYVFGTLLNRDKFYNSYTVVNFPRREIWFCFPSGGSDFSNLAVLWNWEKKTVGLRDLRGSECRFGSSGVVVESGESVTWG